jgi:hypothetical protein
LFWDNARPWKQFWSCNFQISVSVSDKDFSNLAFKHEWMVKIFLVCTYLFIKKMILMFCVGNPWLITFCYSPLITTGLIHMKTIVSGLFCHWSVISSFHRNITTQKLSFYYVMYLKQFQITCRSHLNFEDIVGNPRLSCSYNLAAHHPLVNWHRNPCNYELFLSHFRTIWLAPRTWKNKMTIFSYIFSFQTK